MRRYVSFFLPTLFLLFTLSACTEASNGTEDGAGSMPLNDGPCPSLEGSWELVSIASDAPAFDLEEDYEEAPTLKILNKTHWMFIRQSSDRFIHSQGGRYTLEDSVYTEIVEYSALPSNIGRSYEFTCRVEGDSIWHHVGGLGDNRYNEIWRRVD